MYFKLNGPDLQASPLHYIPNFNERLKLYEETSLLYGVAEIIVYSKYVNYVHTA